MDNSAAMLRHAGHLAAEAGAAVELVQGTLGSVSETLQLGTHPVSEKIFCQQVENLNLRLFRFASRDSLPLNSCVCLQ